MDQRERIPCDPTVAQLLRNAYLLGTAESLADLPRLGLRHSSDGDAKAIAEGRILTRSAVHVSANFAVDAESPEQAFEWLNHADTRRATSSGHIQSASHLDAHDPAALRARDEAGYEAASGGWPLGAQRPPAAGPAHP